MAMYLLPCSFVMSVSVHSAPRRTLSMAATGLMWAIVAWLLDWILSSSCCTAAGGAVAAWRCSATAGGSSLRSAWRGRRSGQVRWSVGLLRHVCCAQPTWSREARLTSSMCKAAVATGIHKLWPCIHRQCWRGTHMPGADVCWISGASAEGAAMLERCLSRALMLLATYGMSLSWAASNRSCSRDCQAQVS